MAIAHTEDGVALSYESRGGGPLTLLFMHGWAGSGSYFAPRSSISTSAAYEP